MNQVTDVMLRQQTGEVNDAPCENELIKWNDYDMNITNIVLNASIHSSNI